MGGKPYVQSGYESLILLSLSESDSIVEETNYAGGPYNQLNAVYEYGLYNIRKDFRTKEA